MTELNKNKTFHIDVREKSSKIVLEYVSVLDKYGMTFIGINVDVETEMEQIGGDYLVLNTSERMYYFDYEPAIKDAVLTIKEAIRMLGEINRMYFKAFDIYEKIEYFNPFVHPCIGFLTELMSAWDFNDGDATMKPSYTGKFFNVKLFTGQSTVNSAILTSLKEQNKYFFPLFWIKSDSGGNHYFKVLINE